MRNIGENQLKILNHFTDSSSPSSLTLSSAGLLEYKRKTRPTNVIKYCKFEIDRQSKSSIFYLAGNKGSLCILLNLVLVGSYHIDGDVIADKIPKLVVEMRKFSTDYERSFNSAENIMRTINVELEDLYNGKEVTLQINRDVICSECRGNGCIRGKSPMKCPDCNGKGQRMIEQRMGFMIQRQIIPCTKCRGTGEIIGENDRCHHCLGKKVEKEKKRITVHIEPGMEDGDQIKFLGCSDEAPNADRGDVIIVLHLKKNDLFIRNHDNLLMVKKITLSEALVGFKNRRFSRAKSRYHS